MLSPLHSTGPVVLRSHASTRLDPHIAAISGFSTGTNYYSGAVGPNGGDAMTLCAFMRCVRGGAGVICGKFDGSTRGYALMFSGLNTVLFAAFDGDNEIATSPSMTLTERDFHTVAGVLDGTVARLFVDGEEVEGERGEISVIEPYTGGSFGIGARGTGAQGSSGLYVAGTCVLGSDAIDALTAGRWHSDCVSELDIIEPRAGEVDVLWSAKLLGDGAPASWVDEVSGAALAMTGALSHDLYSVRR